MLPHIPRFGRVGSPHQGQFSQQGELVLETGDVFDDDERWLDF